MNSDPLVSVIIPTYNRSEIVLRAIDNVFQQTYRNLELIIVDDGSTDDTQSKLRKYGDRIRLITQSNAGPAVARNRGAKAARGEIIAFQDSDDLWKSTKLERQVALLTEYKLAPCCLCNTLMSVVDGKKWTSFGDSLIDLQHPEGLWLNVSDVLATRFVLFNQAVAIRRKVFDKVGGFREDLRYLEDYDLPLRLSLEGPWAFIREPLVIYGECTPASFSQTAMRDQLILRECAVKIFERMLTLVNGKVGRANLRKLLKHRLWLLRLLLIAAKAMQANFWAARVIGQTLIILEHCLRAAYRRSPWFPPPITTPYEDRVETRLLSVQQI
jgi:glycosyltransferase involved in cell wall biosynthesis